MKELLHSGTIFLASSHHLKIQYKRKYILGIPLFNHEHLNRQKLQTINSAYSQVSYIQQECRPYLKLFQEGLLPLLRTDERFRFQTLVEEKEPHESFVSSKFQLINLNNKGRYVIFPTKQFSLSWNPEKPQFQEDEIGSIKNHWITSEIELAMKENATLVVFAPKIYSLEYQMVLSIQNKLKTMFLGN